MRLLISKIEGGSVSTLHKAVRVHHEALERRKKRQSAFYMRKPFKGIPIYANCVWEIPDDLVLPKGMKIFGIII